VDRRDLLFRPGVPRAAVPVVSVLTDFLDLLAALPVLAVFLVLDVGLHWTAILFPVVLFVQLLLILGFGYLLCAANVWVRDVRHLVITVMALGFYITPVFYGRTNVPERFRWVQTVNPMTHLLEAHRAVLIRGEVPDRGFAVVALFAGALFTTGTLVYNRLSGTFVDEL
jgi:ABC-type polysaccharide/polyol phosphate export permease